jgi:glycosyltransferase involved in cell wall biosynthesis
MPRPLNVLHVIATLAGGGVERLLVKSLTVLNRTDFTHQVCCISGGGVYEEELRSLEVPCWVLKRRARFDPTVILQMVRLMRRAHIDVVHTLNFTANAWGRLAAKLAGVPRVIAHERGTAWTESAVMRQVDKSLYRFTDLWLANSEAAAVMLKEHVRVPAGRIRVVYNGLPEPSAIHSGGSLLRERLGIDPRVPLVGAVGRLVFGKGHLFLLRAIPFVWQAVPETHFALIGDGPLRSYLEAEAHRLGLLTEGKVHFLGFLLDAANLMQEMDLLVHPAIYESLGNVLIEAGLARLPVVASEVDGCSEVVVHGETGLLVDCVLPVGCVRVPGASPLPNVVVDGRTQALRPPLAPHPEALAEAMVRLLQNPQVRYQMGRQARDRARRVFSVERYARDLERAYRGDL